jgi:hypothetical protein
MTFEEYIKPGSVVVADCFKKANLLSSCICQRRDMLIKVVADEIKDVDGDVVFLKQGSKTLKNAIHKVWISGSDSMENPNYDLDCLFKRE